MRELICYIAQAPVGSGFGSVRHLCHQGFDVFTQTVRATGHQAECVIFCYDDHWIPLTITPLRLAFSSHHLEYGFPSTHTTNSISIALFLYSYVHRLYFSEASISSASYYSYLAAIIFYTFSIVFGRIYAAMHSFTDCAFGVIIGATIWALQHLYLERIGEAIENGSWIGKSHPPPFPDAH